MAAGHSWNSVTFDDAVVVGGIEEMAEERNFAYPGVNGVETIHMGTRGKSITLAGKYNNTTIANVLAWFTTAWGKLGEASTLSLWNGALSLENCKLMRLRFVGLRPGESGFTARYQATFMQKQPNA